MVLLKEIIIIFSISIGVLFVFNRLKIPSIVGFLVTGIFIGPHSLGLISSTHDVEVLSEIGIILLLFTIGMELSVKNLLQLKRSVLLGGALQVFITIAAIFLIFTALGKTVGNSLFYGFLISLSSTTIVLKILQEKSEIDTPYGKLTLSILIFQDIAIVPMMLAAPILAGGSGSAGISLLLVGIKSVGIIVFVIVSIKWVVPWLFYQITRTRSRELFILSIFVICFSVAWLTYSIGLSLALGAFLAGLIVSETDYSHEAISNIIPFRDVFTSIFFISVGMLLDVGFIAKMPLLIAATGTGVFLIKCLVAILAAMLLGFPLRTTILVGLALCQVGEFSFILSKTGMQLGLLGETDYQLFLAVSVFTMIATPFIMNYSPKLADVFMRIPLPVLIKNGLYRYSSKMNTTSTDQLKDHLIIVGYGVNGRNVSRSAKIAEIPYVIVEMNPDTVKKELKNGELIFYGDASHEDILKHVRIADARVIAIAIHDAAATRRIVVTARKFNSLVHIIARTRFTQEVNDLYELGANEVIPEEFETSVEIFTRVLNKYRIPQNDIKNLIDYIRSDGYRMYRSYAMVSSSLPDEIKMMRGMEFITYRVEKGSPASNRLISDLNVRKKYGVLILAIYRGELLVYNPDGDSKILPDDILLLLGTSDAVSKSIPLFTNSNNNKGVYS